MALVYAFVETKDTVISLTRHNLLNSLLEGQNKDEVEKAGNRQKSKTLASEAPADSSRSPSVLCSAHALHFAQRESCQRAGSRRATLLLFLHKPISNLTCLFQHLDPMEMSAIEMRDQMVQAMARAKKEGRGRRRQSREGRGAESRESVRKAPG